MKYKCFVCGYTYDHEKGDPDSGVKPGTPFASLPDSWTCPVCGGLVALEAVDWRHDRPAPRVGLSFTPRSRLIQP